MMPIRGLARREHQPVRHVHPQEGERRRDLVFVEPFLLQDRVVAGADVEPPRGHPEGPGDDARHPVERAVDGRGRFDRVLDAFEADPQPGETRQRKPISRNR
jgi:hypothetical protein